MKKMRSLWCVTFVLCLVLGPSLVNAQTSYPSVLTYGAVCNSNGSSGNGTDDSSAFVTADAAGSGWAVPIGKTCRIGSSHTFVGPAAISGRVTVDSGVTLTLTGTVTVFNPNAFPSGVGTVNFGADGFGMTTVYGDIQTPWPFGSPPAGYPTTLPGDPMGAQSLATTGTVTVWRQFLYGWGNNATALSVTGGLGPPYQAGVLGGSVSDVTAPGWYIGGDEVGGVIQNFGTSKWLYQVPGTISGNTLTFTTPLSAAQIVKLRAYEIVDTQDSPTCSGFLTAWSPTGASVTVAGWYRQHVGTIPAASCTPVSSNTATIRHDTVYGANLVAQRTASNQEIRTVGLEIDLGLSSNDPYPDFGHYANLFPTMTTYNQPSSDVGLLIVNNSNFTASSGLFVCCTNWVDGMLFEGGAAGSAVHVASYDSAYIQTAFTADINYANWPASTINNGFVNKGAVNAFYSADRAGNAGWLVTYNGDMDVGTQTLTPPAGGSGGPVFPPAPAANSPTWKFYTSASGNLHPDSQIVYSGGSGGLDGTVTISTGKLLYNVTNELRVSGGLLASQSITPIHTQACVQGQFGFGTDGSGIDWIYWCKATNTWVRTAMNTYLP